MKLLFHAYSVKFEYAWRAVPKGYKVVWRPRPAGYPDWSLSGEAEEARLRLLPRAITVSAGEAGLSSMLGRS